MRQKFQVFISSTFYDLQDHRDAVIKAILKMGHIPVGMEAFGAANENSWQLIQKTIIESDYYIVIVAKRYGSLHDSSGLSWTEREFDFAINNEIPCLAFLIDWEASWPGNLVDFDGESASMLNAFREKIKKKLNVDFWKNADDLALKVTQGLSLLIASCPRPGWGKLSEDSKNVTLELARLSKENAELKMRLDQDAAKEIWEKELSVLYSRNLVLKSSIPEESGKRKEENESSQKIPMIIVWMGEPGLFIHWIGYKDLEGRVLNFLFQLEKSSIDEVSIDSQSLDEFCFTLYVLGLVEMCQDTISLGKHRFGVGYLFRLSHKGKDMITDILSGNLKPEKFLKKISTREDQE